MKFVFTLLVCCISSAAFALQPLDGSDGDTQKLLLANVVGAEAVGPIGARVDENHINQGYGTLIAPNKVLTAWHVLAGSDLAFFNCGGVFYQIVGVKRVAGRPDLAVATLDKPVPGVTPLSAATRPPAIGSSVIVVGTLRMNNQQIPAADIFPVSSVGEEFISSAVRTTIANYTNAALTSVTAFAHSKIEEGDSGSPWLAYEDGRLVIAGVTRGYTLPHWWESGLIQDCVASPAWAAKDFVPQTAEYRLPINPVPQVVLLTGIFIGVRVCRRAGVRRKI